MLEERRSKILRSLVECYIRTGAPVSSRTVLEYTDLEVSPATIRKELARLEEEGYVAQPHTSAGRVPTAHAYRYYVDNHAAFQLRRTVQARISSFFSEVELELDRLLHATSRLLSDITRLPAVVVGPRLAAERIRSIHLVSLQLRLALMVVVTESARVLQELCHLPAPMTKSEISDMERLVRSHAVGSRLDVRTPPALTQPTGPNDPFQSCLQEVWDALERAALRASDIYVMGTGRLADLWDDLDAVARVLSVLEREDHHVGYPGRRSGDQDRHRRGDTGSGGSGSGGGLHLVHGGKFQRTDGCPGPHAHGLWPGDLGGGEGQRRVGRTHQRLNLLANGQGLLSNPGSGSRR